MKYRGIRYTIRVRIDRNKWIVAIHPVNTETREKGFTGSRQLAERLARSMIDTWLTINRKAESTGRDLGPVKT